MKLIGKITRILLKTLLYSVIVLLLLLISLFFIGQTESFQTWAAQGATKYLSKELGTTVKVRKLKIGFIKNVTLDGIFVGDKHNDTLLSGGSIKVNVSGFNYKLKTLNLDEAILTDVKVKLLKHKNEEDFNFQFLADYFSSKDTTKPDSVAPWKIKYGALVLNNVDFTYRLMRDTIKVTHFMNYNNIHVSNIYGKFTDINFKNDTIFSQITNLSAKEQCGIVIKNLTTNAKISSTRLQCDSLYLKTDNSLVKGNLIFKYDTWADYSDFINKVYIKANLKDSTTLNMKDITYFSEDIKGFEEVFKIKGKVNGFVNDLNGSDLAIKYGKNTEFIGDFSISGLPDFNKSFIHFDAKKLSTSKADLEKFPIPPFDKATHLELPKEIAKLGVINYKGKFDGFINDFATYGTFVTDIGSLKTDLLIKNNPKTNIIEYSGNLATTNFNVAKLFPSAGIIGPVSLSTKINGKGLSLKEMDTKLDGGIQSITYNKYQYKDLKIDGTFENKIFKGALLSKDPNADFDFNGTVDLNFKVPKMDFISTINNFDLEKTNFSTSKLNGKISSQILINLNGDDIDNLTGQVNFDNTIYTTATKEYKLSSLNLDLDQASIDKKIKLNSNIANAQLSGKYNLSTLSAAFTQYLNNYFPTFFKTSSRHIYSDEADIDVKIKNFTIIKELFINDLMISPNTTLKGSFDASINYLYLKTNSAKIDYAGIKFKNNDVDINSLPNGISLAYNANSIELSDSMSFKNPSLNLISNDKTSQFDLSWNNLTSPNYSGLLRGNMLFGATQASIVLDKVKISVSDSIWQLVKPNPITIDSAYEVTINPITFYNNNQLITVDGKLSKNQNDKCNIFIQNFKLSQFNPLLSKSKTTINGSVTGNTEILGAFGKSIINSNINYTDLRLNNKLIGFGEIKSEYNPEKEYVTINGFSAFAKDFDGNLLKNIEFEGYYYTKKTEDNIDIKFKAEPFDLSLLQPFLKDIITFKVGFLNGNGTVTGTLDDPQINAKLKIMKCVMLVDYLNVQYAVSGNVDIFPTQINFDNLEVRDKSGNVGIVYGNIFHKKFDNIRIDFDINTKKLMLLNTTAANNPSYYGTAYASGNAGIYGFTDDIKMEINMKTNGGTRFYIPLDGPSEIGDNEFIQFVTKDTIKKIVTKSNSNLSLDFNLEATSDAEVQLIFDEKSGDVIKAKGDGNLSMKINSKGKFDMFGDYVLSTGDYLFTLEDFVTKKFEIEKGSSIKWNGNVYKANIDITANYKQRASIKPLFPNDSSSNYNKRFPVDCKLYMRDKLTSPDISFGVELPTIDEGTRSLIRNLLADPTELNRQVFSLLLLRSFVTPISVTGGSGVSAGGAMAATGSEMLSNKLSSWLNGVTKDVDIGVNYRPGNALSSDELDLALSKQLFNNRLVIDGNFGVTNNSTTTKTTNNSNLIGDVTAELKLTESGKYRVKGFNRSNDNTQILYSGGPFTQGVGIFYREEFENLSELYRRYLDKLKRKK